MRSMQMIRLCQKTLHFHGIPDAEKEAETFVEFYSRAERVALYRDDPMLDAECISNITSALERRIKREPVSYILGFAEFYGMKIKVGRGALIPRPETELLAEHAVKALNGIEGAEVLDLCTGSGCIAVALACNVRGSHVIGVDKSTSALRYAYENAELNHATNVSFLCGDLFNPAKGFKFDLITANPPYVKSADIQHLDKDIKDYEPLDALDGGADGLDFYRLIIPQAMNYLKPGGLLLMECGIGQSDSISGMARSSGFEDIRFIKDYCGIDRVLSARAAHLSS